MKITRIETVFADAGWRNACFVKIMTDEGIVGWSEYSEHTGTAGITGVVKALAELLIGRDPLAIEEISGLLRGRTMQAGGGVNQHAIAALVNGLFDIKGKAFGVPVYQLLGGAARDRLPVYWSHCGSYRIRHGEMLGKPPVRNFDDIAKLGEEVRARGFRALKTGFITLQDGRIANFGPGFAFSPGWPALNIDRTAIDATARLVEAFIEGAGPDVAVGLDCNFHFKTEGYLEIVRALEPYRLMWLEIDSYDPAALAYIRSAAHFPIASLEALLGRRMMLPFLEAGAADVGIIDITWNGYLESLRMASLCALFEVNVATHAYCAGGLGDLISAHFAATIPNLRIMEFDVDDIPWKSDFLTGELVVENGDLLLPTGPGWGFDVDEKGLAAHPVK